MGLPVGAKGIDSASRVDSNQAKASGSNFQVRYSSGAATDPNHASHNASKFKLLQDGEFAAILASGQDIFANDEWSTDRMYGGAAAAEQDAPAVLAYWRAEGLAKGATISLNHDTGLDMSRINAIEAYYDRYNQILGGEYVADSFYGPLAGARALAQSGRIKHFWIPEGASFFCAKASIDQNYAPPAKTNWDLWAPTPSQVNPAIQWLLAQMQDILPLLQSVVWQDLNHWFNGAADENIVLKGDFFGSHLEAAGGQTGGETTPPPPPTGGGKTNEQLADEVLQGLWGNGDDRRYKLTAAGYNYDAVQAIVNQRLSAPPAGKIYQGLAVPSLIAKGTGQYLGSISGPAASHGGYNASEKPVVKILQQRLIACGFVPGQTDPNSGWADGVYDTPQDKPNTGATSQAVARFQHAHMPNTQFYGQCWYDDWTTLFNL